MADDYRRLEYEMSLCTGQTEGELRLGAGQYDHRTIPAAADPGPLTARFPQVRVSLLSGNSEQVEQALGDHAIDLGLVESVSRRQGLHYTLFRSDELVLVARPGREVCRTESVTPKRCATSRWCCARAVPERSK